ncbi:haloacid dehalogenase [Curtobacterium sp. MCSS17_006]|uniref:HAD family hydrolase n=1 Tax=unclassified Curtobacterium TaxID=257496 RepID=UPI000DA8844C|nr:MULTISPECIES: HAD-IB family phosphatase [unclassified Curtobacterium]PZE32862.1 haloacid dehalogenase [Curtobacterium sp. MCSS17_006]WIB33229.1 HAD-IB family phosphatase [Curtobacterium sp. MCSS17_005]
MSTRGIVFFDIDGTLVPSMSSSSFLAKRFGHAPALDAAEQRYAEGELTNEEVSVIDAEGWREIPTRTVAAWLEELPLIAGIDAVVAWCVEHDVEPILASLAWQPVAEAIAKRHGLTANGGPRVQVVGTDYDGTVAEHFNEYDKRDRALQLAAERGVSIDHCCAIGDSRSDLPLFDALPASLALNASGPARAAASAAIDTDDLRDVIPWLEAWKATLH